jgi:anti-sigma factor RsiW
MNDRDYEIINAYIDGALTEAERRIFESRLNAEPELRRELNSLRQTVALLRQMPRLKAPRDFTLTPAQVEVRPASRPVLPFPLTATFSALSAAAAVLLFVFGGYFLLQSGIRPMASSLDTTTMQQAAQEAAPAEVALALTATLAPTSSPMPTMPLPSPVPQQERVEGVSAPAAALAPPAEEQQADQAGTIMMFEADDGAHTPADDAETSAFRMVITDAPAQPGVQATDPAAADLAADGAGAAMMPTQAIRVPNPMMTDAAFLATLGANMAQYAGTPLPAAETIEAAASNEAGADAMDALSEELAEPPMMARDRVQRAPDTDLTGPLLLVVGGLLLGIAMVTTVLRRRRSTR